MRYITQEQRDALQRWLEIRAAMLRREITEALRRSGSDAAIGLANHLEEVDDEAVADLESVIEVAQIERDLRELREVERGLARLEEPEYGVCVDCGEDIPYARLDANPVATRCTACQDRAEHVLAEAAPPALTRG